MMSTKMSKTVTYLNADNYMNFFSKMKNTVIFAPDFNEDLDGFDFDDNVSHITFGTKFNKSLDNVLFPPYIYQLELGQAFNQSIDNIKFTNIENIIIFGAFNTSISKFPESLLSIYIGGRFNKTLEHTTFPPNLESFELNTVYCYKLPVFPDTLTSLSITGIFNSPLNYYKFPTSRTFLDFGNFFNQSLDDCIFSNKLEILNFGDRFNQEFNSYIPSLKTLRFGSKFDQIIKYMDNLTTLQISPLFFDFDLITSHFPNITVVSGETEGTTPHAECNGSRGF